MDKDFILGEIRRMAALNGGKPLGRLRLESEAGIKEYHWGKHWARYNDALREAGFEPNAATAPYSEQQLFETLAALARRLGRFPTQADMKLASASGSDFPSLKTFVTRFGNKPEMVKRVVAFCEQAGDHADLLSMCAAVESVAPDVDTQEHRGDTTNDGFVYLMKSGKHYKIGRTNHVGRRERELAIQLPEQAKTAHFIRTDDPEGIEAYWHRRFAAKRKNGEWFELSPQDVAAFRRRKFM